MGLLDTIANAFGFRKPVVEKALVPFHLTVRAVKRLGDARAVVVRLSEVDDGVVAIANEAPREGADALQVTEADRDRLIGLELDYDGDRWLVRTAIDLRAQETPNPNSRRFILDRRLCDGRAFFSRPDPGAPRLVREMFAIPGVHSVLFNDRSVNIERVPGVDWRAVDAAVAGVLREHVLRAGPRLAPPPRVGDASHDAVRAFLEAHVIPALHADGGDLELVSIEYGVVSVRLIGACRSCPAASVTLKAGVEAQLMKAFPEVERVEQV